MNLYTSANHILQILVETRGLVSEIIDLLFYLFVISEH